MRIVVTGSREFSDEWLFDTIMEGLTTRAKDENDWIELAHGGHAKGADAMAQRWEGPATVRPYYAEWDEYGKAAGPLRNRRMLEVEEPDLVLAFFEPGAENKGTQDCVDAALAKGYRVVEIRPRRPLWPKKTSDEKPTHG